MVRIRLMRWLRKKGRKAMSSQKFDLANALFDLASWIGPHPEDGLMKALRELAEEPCGPSCPSYQEGRCPKEEK